MKASSQWAAGLLFKSQRKGGRAGLMDIEDLDMLRGSTGNCNCCYKVLSENLPVVPGKQVRRIEKPHKLATIAVFLRPYYIQSLQIHIGKMLHVWTLMTNLEKPGKTLTYRVALMSRPVFSVSV